MTFGSLFAGIGGFDCAASRAGIEHAWQVELDRQCRSVLERHFPGVQRIADVNAARAIIEPKNHARIATRLVRPDILCGGFPCQDLSVAGQRAGLAGSRSGLWFVFRRIIAVLRPDWVLIENVPGLRSSNGGRDLGAILGALGQLGYGWAFRSLDAQYFGLAQRRERVFIVGCLGNWRRAGEILFESDSVSGDSPPSRETRARVADCLTAGVASGRGVNRPGRRREDDVNLVAGALCSTHTPRGHGARGPSDQMAAQGHLVPVLSHALSSSPTATGRLDPNGETFLPIPLDMRQLSRGDKFTNNRREGTSGGAPGTGIGEEGEPSATVGTTHVPAIAFQTRIARKGRGQPKEIIDALTSCEGGKHADSKPHVATAFGVRRLTPRECERLQGFPDDWTRYAADGSALSDSARYRMLGNAVAVPVVEWILRRIATCR